MVAPGRCHVRDSRAAAFRDAVSDVGLEPDLFEDCVLMASELAANTLHAQAVAGAGGGGIGSGPC